MFEASEIGTILQTDKDSLASPGAMIRHVVIDSRQINRGSDALFIAIKGLRTDGHKYISHAYAAGVRNFIVSDNTRYNDLAESNVFVVPDTVVALQTLASAHRRKFNIPCVGITGSNGKTHVKEWLSQLLLPDYDVVRSPRSYNSQVGVPLSVLQIKEEHELGLFEAGVSMSGEMYLLEKIIKPSIGVITNIGDAHDAGFRDREHKLNEKLDLFQHSEIIIYPSDDGAIHDTVKMRYNDRKLYSWGVGNSATLKVTDVKQGRNTRFKYQYKGTVNEAEIPFGDSASLKNALTCALVLHVLDVEPERIVERLARLQPLSQRLEMHAIGGKSLLINDTYSLDLVSLKVGLETLNQHSIGREKVLILTDVAAQHTASYEEIANLIATHKVDVMFGIGTAIAEMQQWSETAGRMEFFDSIDDFILAKPWEGFNSAVFLLKGARSYGLEKIVRYIRIRSHSAVLEIDLNAMLSNLRQFVNRLDSSTEIIAMVKAAAYGTGSIEVGKFLEHNNVDKLGVAYVDEGVELRQAGVTIPVIVMNPDDESLVHLFDYRLEPDIYSLDLFRRVAHIAKERNQKIKVHIKVDTGMHRLGFGEEDLPALIEEMKADELLEVDSVFTHLAAADEPDESAFTHGQVALFSRMYEQIATGIGYRPMRHVLNSHGVMHYPGYQFEGVRLGIGLYGTGVKGELQPVHKFSGRVSQVRMIAAGDTVGYGRAFTAETEMKIATINVGYADGLPRIAGDAGFKVNISGVVAPIVGRVCMDMCMVDVSAIDSVKAGDPVEIFGSTIAIEDLAKACNTIPYEILTGISPRIPRVFRFD